MALQTSTIVMALVTCVPFGFAIHATVTEKSRPALSDDEEDTLRDYSEQASASEREMARLERDAQARLAVKRRGLIGPRPASLGPAFPELVLGTRNDEIPTSTVRALRELQRKTDLTVELSDGVMLTSIEIGPQNYASETEIDALCSELSGLIAGAGWGPGVVVDDDDVDSARQWHDAATSRRATLTRTEGTTCTLGIDQAVAPGRWIAKDESSIVPLWAVGQPASKLTTALGERASREDESGSFYELWWDAPGVEHGKSLTRLNATITRGKVTRLTVGVQTTSPTRAAVIEQLKTLYGEPTVSEDDDDVLRWRKARPPIELSSDEDDRMMVVVGTPE